VVAGDYEVDALLDAEASFTTYSEGSSDASEDDWACWRERHPELFDADRWRVPFRSFLIRGSGRAILVDTAVGPPDGDFLPDAQGWLPAELERLGARPDTIFLTHVHVDHVRWNAAFEGVRSWHTGTASRCRRSAGGPCAEPRKSRERRSWRRASSPSRRPDTFPAT
jgi:glyoxylase-like metal-dependent hydrolase (beta-lactamase superfamily II)